MFKSVNLKLGSMRKPQEFVVCEATVIGTNKRVITGQSDKCTFRFDTEKDEFIFTNKGCYNHHLSMYGQPMEITDEQKESIKGACYRKGDSLGGIAFMG